MRYFLCIISIIILLSCKKERIHKNHSELIGRWAHYLEYNRIEVLDIGENSKGTIEYYNAGEGLTSDSNIKIWKVKNNTLFFGRVTPQRFEITQYPAVAINAFIQGFDTVTTNQTYVLLNGGAVYVKQ